MFNIIADNTCIGVCAAPYASEGETIQVGYILIDGFFLKNNGLGFNNLELPEFDLTQDGEVVYERCRVNSRVRSFYMTNQRGVLFEDSQVQFLWHHKQD